MSKTILVIPDSHATPKHNNTRFDILGRFIMDRQPDVIVNIGDMADFESLCSYDKGKASFEGRRYKKDVEAVIDAQARMFAPMYEYNAKMKATKHKQYKPELYITLGNHENRVNRVIQYQPELEGTIGIEDLKYEEFGWKVIPYTTPITISGIVFCHHFSGGVMGRPISGEHPAYSHITKLHSSCVAGHSHLRDFCERTTAEGKKLTSTIVGCYLDEDQWEGYAGEANKLWWRGICILNNCKDGEYDPEFIGIKALKEKYGKV